MSTREKIVGASTATSKGQTTIPKAIRNALGIKDGTKLDWEIRDGDLRVVARTKRLVDYAGILGNPLGRAVSVDEMNQAVLDETAERFRHKTTR